MTKRILIIDDDETIRTLVAFCLREEGYEVLSARNGAEGLALLENYAADMILLDMRMPVMSGWEFADRLRASPYVAPPIIVFTAAVNASDRAADIQADGFLAKPFDLDDLSAIVRKTVGRAQQREA